MCLVTSKRPHAYIKNIDIDQALKSEGVVDFISWKDVTGSNDHGLPQKKEQVFAKEKVNLIYTGKFHFSSIIMRKGRWSYMYQSLNFRQW